MSSPAAKSPYAGYRFPAEVISQAVWLYFRFPLSLRMVEEMLAARGIIVRWDFLPAVKDLMGGRAEPCSVV
jgi:transposase-like protein